MSANKTRNKTYCETCKIYVVDYAKHVSSNSHIMKLMNGGSMG